MVGFVFSNCVGTIHGIHRRRPLSSGEEIGDVLPAAFRAYLEPCFRLYNSRRIAASAPNITASFSSDLYPTDDSLSANNAFTQRFRLVAVLIHKGLKFPVRQRKHGIVQALFIAHYGNGSHIVPLFVSFVICLKPRPMPMADQNLQFKITIWNSNGTFELPFIPGPHRSL